MNTMNEQQILAVTDDSRRIVCLAGAGSGKTFTMLNRISRLIDEGVDPQSILALTFTRASALDMKSRYILNHKNSICPEFKTFHAFCYTLLSTDREILHTLGYHNVPAIADDNDIIKMKAKIHAELNIKQKPENKLLTPKEQFQQELYNKRLKKLMNAENVISFDTLSKEVCNLFESNDTCIQVYKDKYKYIFIDEFQDTDPTQFKFMLSFENSNLFVVGDVLQSIYGFRNADSHIIKSLIDSKDWKTIKLFKNYRSKNEICNFANKITGYADKQYRIELSGQSDGGSVSVFCLEDERGFYDPVIPEDEINDILHELKQLSRSTAILCRTNKEVNYMCSYLDREHISYVRQIRTNLAEKFLRSVFNNEYFIEWVSTELNSKDYGTYLRLFDLNTPENPVLYFYRNFGKIDRIRYLMDTVFSIRQEFKKDTSPNIKCRNILELLDVKDVLVDTDAKSTREIYTYLIDTVNKKLESDVYVGTVHSVKGLEYDNVFVVGVNDRSFHLDSEENHNLYYVAVTRARNWLKVYYV